MSSKRIEKEFTSAFERYSDALYRHCYFRTYSRERARDVVQETFLKTWDYVRAGNSIDNLRAFLYQVATNIIIDESRKLKNVREVSLETLQEKGFDLEDHKAGKIEDTIEAQMLLPVLDELDEKYREAVMFRYIDNLMPREIAEITGENENVISVRIHRGLKQLRKLLKQNGYYEIV